MITIALLSDVRIHSGFDPRNRGRIIVHDQSVDLQFIIFFLNKTIFYIIIYTSKSDTVFFISEIPAFLYSLCLEAFHRPWLAPWTLQRQSSCMSMHVFLGGAPFFLAFVQILQRLLITENPRHFFVDSPIRVACPIIILTKTVLCKRKPLWFTALSNILNIGCKKHPILGNPF